MKKSKKVIPIEGEPELKALNHELYSDFSVQELEERLETKPWICGVHGGECGVDGVEVEK